MLMFCKNTFLMKQLFQIRFLFFQLLMEWNGMDRSCCVFNRYHIKIYYYNSNNVKPKCLVNNLCSNSTSHIIIFSLCLSKKIHSRFTKIQEKNSVIKFKSSRKFFSEYELLNLMSANKTK